MKTDQQRPDSPGDTSALMGKLSNFLAAENPSMRVAISAMLNLAFNATLQEPALWPTYLRGQEVLREKLLELSGGQLHRAAHPQAPTDAVGVFAQHQCDRTPSAAVDKLAALTIELQTWLQRKNQPMEAQLDALLSMYVSLVNANPQYRQAARDFGDVLHQLFGEAPAAAASAAASPLTH